MLYILLLIYSYLMTCHQFTFLVTCHWCVHSDFLTCSKCIHYRIVKLLYICKPLTQRGTWQVYIFWSVTPQTCLMLAILARCCYQFDSWIVSWMCQKVIAKLRLGNVSLNVSQAWRVEYKFWRLIELVSYFWKVLVGSDQILYRWALVSP